AGSRRQRARTGDARFYRTNAQHRDRHGVALPRLLDALDRVLTVAQVVDVRHQEREAGARDEVEPVAVRRLVGGFGHADVEGDLRILVHDAASACPGRTRGAPARAAAAGGRWDATAAARLAGFRIGVVDGRVLVDLLPVHARAEAVRPLAVACLAPQVHRADVGVAVDLLHDVFAKRFRRLDQIRLARIADARQVGVPAPR